MNLEKAYEDRFGKFPLSNITMYLVIGNVVAYCLNLLYPDFDSHLRLSGRQLLDGEWWRLVTVLFVPFARAPIWVAFGWYLAYIMGTALENVWGSFRYALYLAISYISIVIAAFLFPIEFFSNGYLYSSSFLAFAYLVPDFTLQLFFIIPVKIKWFAFLTWIGFAYSLFVLPVPQKIQALLAIANFLLFFGSEIFLNVKSRLKHGSFVVATKMNEERTYMYCSSCKATENDRKIFYYCHSCVPDTCYCEDHINAHRHVGGA